MSDNAETTGSPPTEGSAESVRRVRALAGDLVARPLDEPAADRLAAMLSDLPLEDRAALRSLARGRNGIEDHAYTRLTDPGGDQGHPDAPAQGSGSYRALRQQQGAHRR